MYVSCPSFYLSWIPDMYFLLKLSFPTHLSHSNRTEDNMQLTLEQCGFELHCLLICRFFKNKYCTIP